MAGAVSADRDLYIWGRAGPGDDGDIEHLPETPEDVGLVDLGDGIDVVDVALGAGHVLALTSRGDVYGVGRNEYGQTGSDTNGAFQRRWTKAVGFWKGVITAVYSGSGASSSLAVAELHQLRK